MNSEQEFQKAMSQAPVAKITDSSGATTFLTGGEVGKYGLTGQVPSTGPVNVYKTATGWTTKNLDESFIDASVHLDKKTGNITVNAPSSVINNETFRKNIQPQLEQLSADYKLNPDTKYSVTDESGQNKEKSIQDIVDELNAPIKKDDNTYNMNSIKYLAASANRLEVEKQAHKKNVELTDDDVIRMNTIAIGPDVKPNSLQLISDLPEAAWLRNVGTYDAETGMAQYGDIMENAYNKEKVSSEDMIKLWAALENYFEKGDYSDKEQYIKNVATARFLDATQPNMAWIRDVTENVRGFLDSIGSAATDIGTAGVVAAERIGAMIVGISPDDFETYFEMYGEDYGDLYVSRGGTPNVADMPQEKVDAKIGRIKFDDYGVPTYVQESIAGSFEEPHTTGEMLRAVFKENQAVIRKDMEYLHESQAAWDQVGYALTHLAALISAGNLLSDVFTVGTGALIGKAATVAGKTATAVNDITSTARALYASGTAFNFGYTAAEAAQIVSGMRTIYDIAAASGKAATFLNFIGNAAMSASATEFIIGVVGESVAEAVVGDTDRFVDVLRNSDIDADTKNYLIETYTWNAVGWGVGFTFGKILMKAGETTRGRAISANISRRLYKIQNGVGDAFDRFMLTVRRVKGDDLAEKIKNLYEKGGKYAKKQANALTANVALRQMRDAVSESDSIKILGKSTDEINDALKDIEKKINVLKGAENALTSMQRQGVDIVQGWLKNDGKGIKEVTENFYSKASKLADMEKASGDLFKPTKGAVTNLNDGRILRLFSQTTTNYIKASEKLDFITAYLRKYDHAASISQDILRKINAYKDEIPSLQKMILTFKTNASSELVLAANNFIDADRKWWARFENLRAEIGLTDKRELMGMRRSGLWGNNGELYARTSRKTDLSEYVVRHRDGASNVKTFDNYEGYMAGAEGDFADPMGEMQIALYDAGNKQAYRSFVRSYDTLTGSLTTKVTGEETALYQNIKGTLETTYFDSSEQFLKGIVEETETGGFVEDVIKNLRLKSENLGDMAKVRASMKTAANRMEQKLSTITSENVGEYIVRLDPSDTNALWDDFYDVSVQELLRDGKEFVPNEAKRFIFGKARELGLLDGDNTADGHTLLKTYDAVNKSLAGTADTSDMVFEQQVKRLIMSHNEDIANDARVQSALTERQKIYNRMKYENFYKERETELKFLEDQYDITKEELSVAGGATVRGYIDSMTREGTGQRAAIDELCRYYGLEGDKNAVKYFALSAFMDNEGKYKHEIYERIKSEIEQSHPELKFAKVGKTNKSQAEKVSAILTNGIDATIKEEFNDARLIVSEINPEATRKDTEKVMKEVDRIAKEIEGAEANRYAGEKNIIAMRNMQGQVEYYQVDPLLARLVNFQYTAEKLNGFTQAIYNTNYLWTKLFRLGTTAINLKSMVNQSFRDPINMFIGGGAYRTTQRCMDDIVDVAGDDVVAWIKTYEPEAIERLQRQAAETGESIQKLAVKREFEIGKAMSPATTETSMYRSLATAKKARFNGVLDIYDDTAGDKFVRGIDKVGETLGKGNEWRETTLRNLSYQNGLATAIKRGYSLDEARTFATFVMNEATTNFSRMTSHLVSIRDTVPYFGSAINGAKSFYKLLSMDPVGVVGRLIGGLIIPSMALTAYSLMSEENRKIYKNIPEYQKEDSLVFMVNGQAFSIPIPQELGAFVAPFRQTVEGMYDVTTNTFAQFAWNDILGFSPVELDGFADLDFAKLEQSSPGFMERIGKGISKMWAQLAPAPLKSGLEVVTGVDPYTGKEIDKSYLDYDENGNPIIKDYQSGETSKLLNNMFRSWGLSSSAPVVQNILANIFGQGSLDIADFLVSLGTQVPNGGWAFAATEQQLSRGEVYNPLYVLGDRMTDPVVLNVYNEAQSAWKTEVAKLYNRKKEILRSDEWSEYLEAKRSTDDPEKLKNINASKKNIVEDYFNTIKNVVNNLQSNYGEEFTPAKYATVLSLMTMEEQTLDAGSYGDYLNKEEYKTARAQAIQTMINMGFPATSSRDALGTFTTDKDGNIYVKVAPPLAILQLDDASGASLRAQSNKQHYTVIKNLMTDIGTYDKRESYYDKVDRAYDAKDYKEVERIMNEYNEEIIRSINPYIQHYGAESVLQGDVMDYLEDYIMVPSSFMGKGKYYSSKTGLNKQQGYAKNYIKAVFGYGEKRIDGNR